MSYNTRYTQQFYRTYKIYIEKRKKLCCYIVSIETNNNNELKLLLVPVHTLF